MNIPPKNDPRLTTKGQIIPTLGYCDQPYIVKADDGTWVCIVTTGAGNEGQSGQTVAVLRSRDRGISWTEPQYLEPTDGPETSYAVGLKCPYGRIYAFYNHNTDRVTEIPREDGGTFERVDSLGHYVFKYSDDHGKTWSKQRHEIPIRIFEIDRNNPYGGDPIRFFWNVGRPIISQNGSIYLPHSKVGLMGVGFYAKSEGVFLKSPNILSEKDPDKVEWITLPDGEVGLRPPENCGRVAEEHTIIELSDQTLYTVYRTVAGYPACAYSRDGGRNWTTPKRKSYKPDEADGRLLKNPRAANFAWQTKAGIPLYWFHNHGGTPPGGLSKQWIGADAYKHRNPAWICAGHEVDAEDGSGKAIEWSEPEILLYDDDPAARLSYPDLIEEDGEFWVTETQKSVARIHKIDPALLKVIMGQHERCTFVKDESLVYHSSTPPASIQMPELPPFRYEHIEGHIPSEPTRFGFTIDLRLQLGRSTGPVIIFNALDERNRGLIVRWLPDHRLQICLSDDVQSSLIHSDIIEPGFHYISLIVDGGPRIAMILSDGYLQDGGDQRDYGWTRFSPTLVHCNGSETATVSQEVDEIRIYNRALYVSEAVGNARAASKREK